MCTTAGGTINIAIGGAAAGIAAVLADANPRVKSVGLGNVNGVTLGYAPGTPGQRLGDQERQHLQDHRHRHRAWTWPTRWQPVNKPFEIDVDLLG